MVWRLGIGKCAHRRAPLERTSHFSRLPSFFNRPIKCETQNACQEQECEPASGIYAEWGDW